MRLVTLILAAELAMAAFAVKITYDAVQLEARPVYSWNLVYRHAKGEDVIDTFELLTDCVEALPIGTAVNRFSCSSERQ